MNNNEYRVGVNRGLPVGMGYFSVSFGFGAMAVSQGLKTLDAVLISATNLTSAGQFAGLTLIVAAATLWEMVLTQLVINSRYALMSLALSQRMGEKIGLLPRLLIAFFNTDEIFALAMAREAPLTVPFLLGLGTLPFIGWTLGTLCGVLACRGSGMFVVVHPTYYSEVARSRPTLRSIFTAQAPLRCHAVACRSPPFMHRSPYARCTSLISRICAASAP